MIPYSGEPMHERPAWDSRAMEGLRRFLAGQRQAFVPEAERCVNEGAEGCAGRAGDNGWCAPCWRTIVPA